MRTGSPAISRLGTWLAIACAAAVGLFAAPASAVPITVHVGRGGRAFVAADARVPVGGTIHWTWDGSGHSVTSGSPPGTPDGAFDSGVRNQGASFDQTFSRPGVYHYFCEVHFALGMVGTVTVVDQPLASFTTTPASPTAGHAVSFDASASSDPGGAGITSYQWTFGDGVSASTSSPVTTHVFGAAKSFKVALVVANAGGTASTPVSHVVRLAADKPAAAFTVRPNPAVAGRSVTFDGSGSHDPDGDAITSYRWSFGDGRTAITSHPSVAHVYAGAGSYRAALSVVDSLNNASAAAAHGVRIKAPYTVPRPPVARFVFSPVHPVLGEAVAFNGSSSTDPDGGRITSYRWLFGDRTRKTTTGPLIDHVYARTGTYMVKLVVLNTRGARSKTVSAKLVVAVAPPRPRVSALRVRTCPHRSRRCRRRGLVVRYVLSAGDHLVLTITRRHHRRAVRRVPLVGRPGRNVVRVRLAHVRRGRYVLALHADGGNTAAARFAWRVR